MDPVTYDQRAAAQDPQSSLAIPKKADVAGIGRRAKHATVFVRQRWGKSELIVLPVHGVGHQSTLYGYLALRGDGNTIAAFNIYEHGETPGYGARVTEPAWRSLWPGKRLTDETDESGAIKIAVVRGTASGIHQVDGISGATRTGNGITNMLRFWLGDYGFAPFLERVRAGES
jgi:Na+-transporting NADH:ubiquinone oxidoreductase subunit C